MFILGCTPEQAPITPIDIGSPAPPIVHANYIQGSRSTLDDATIDKVHIIEFWATWCPPCKESAPILSALQQKYPDQLRIIGITDELESTVIPYLATSGESISYTIALDPDGQIQEAYIKGIGEEGIPWAFLIDTQGKLVWVGHPMSSELPFEIEKLLASKS
jgi:thiol-disulfide isomerase/thioredoxin